MNTKLFGLRIGIALTFVLLLFVSTYSQVGATADAVEDMRHPIDPPTMRSFLIDAIKKGFLRLLYLMDDANFSTQNVLYTTFTRSGSRTYTLNNNDTFGYDLNDQAVSKLKLYINNTLAKLQIANETLIEYNNTAANVWNSSDFQNHPTVNQSSFNSYEEFAISYIAFEIKANADNGTNNDLTPGNLDDFATFVENTPFWKRNLLIEFHLTRKTDIHIPLLYNIFGPVMRIPAHNVFRLIERVITFFDDLWMEIENRTSLSITLSYAVDAVVNVTAQASAAVILYDNDSSVVNAINKIKNNESVDSQPFTGDEVLTMVDQVLIQQEFDGFLETSSLWQYDDGSDAILLKHLVRILSRNRHYAENLARAMHINIDLFREFLGPRHRIINTSDLGHTVKNAYGRFNVAQLKIHNLTLIRTSTGRIAIKNFAFSYFEHRMLGTTLYNDTNENGRLDLGIVRIPNRFANGPQIIPIMSPEAAYRVDWSGVESVTYQKPETVSDDLSMGVTFNNVTARLVPLHIRPEQALFNTSEAVSEQTIDNISIKFHFTIVPENATANLKFDYIIGNWSNKTVVEGLSLNQMFATAVIDSKGGFRRMQMENQTEVDPDTSNTTRVRRFRFAEKTNIDAEIRLDDIPYTWNGTEAVNATGELIPLHAGLRMFGKITQEGSTLMQMAIASKNQVYLYSISYPKFSGETISHDPTFSVVASSPSSSSGTGETSPESSSGTEGNGGAVPGFEVPALLTVMLATSAIYLKKRRK